jgi:hypothetical protein
MEKKKESKKKQTKTNVLDFSKKKSRVQAAKSSFLRGQDQACMF